MWGRLAVCGGLSVRQNSRKNLHAPPRTTSLHEMHPTQNRERERAGGQSPYGCFFKI
jgi:hypothetical protein